MGIKSTVVLTRASAEALVINAIEQVVQRIDSMSDEELSDVLNVLVDVLSSMDISDFSRYVNYMIGYGDARYEEPDWD